MFKEIIYLIHKDLLLEWRQKYAFYGVLLYLISTVFVCYLSLKLKTASISVLTWNAVFWIIILFSAVNAIAKSFIQESKGRHLYYYFLVRPESVILAKILYNSLLMLALNIAGLIIYSVVLDNPVKDHFTFILVLASGSVGFASTFTLIAGIASKAGNNSTLMAILSIPLIIPLILLVMKASKNAIDGIDFGSSSDELIIIGALNFMIISLSYILFPYLWRS